MKTTKTLLLGLLMAAATAQAQTDYHERLTGLIQDAETFLDTCQQEKYTYGMVENLRDAIVMARNTKDGEATSSELRKQCSNINNALTAVTKSFGKPFDTNISPQAYDSERGFLHPGGLHTQEDFDRIKRQLAAGHPKVTEAMNKLKASGYAQPTFVTYPTEKINRGAEGENYGNAMRGAAAAYANALRWKIEDNKDCADAAVRILMAWANVTNEIIGNSNVSLASGIYGYEFAQAAELMRDYEGWSREDFKKFQDWMLNVWYNPAITFLRGRHGTWENVGRWWQAPGHYWSNWPLCNDLCVMTIGVLCDDVFIYNQGISFLKYDLCGTFTDPRTEVPIKNDGLTDFLGNLVVTEFESKLETGAYGRIGQMQESGRDGGHAAMALGLAVDIAHMMWNQGDDFFAYMNHRLASGIEYIAAQALSIENLPWTDYIRNEGGIAYTDSRAWTMTEPAIPVAIRPYWGTVIAHYESIKGVRMPFSEQVYELMGIDEGPTGGTSGYFDHLGYSVLLNTRDVQLAPAKKVPTELSGKIEYKGNIIEHNELGGLNNKYTPNPKNAALPKGETIRLIPVLPEGETNTGQWLWNTGETTQEITVTTDKSYAYRVTYTNQNGITSQQVFTIATQGDCQPLNFTTTIMNGEDIIGNDEATVDYGTTLTFTVFQFVTDWGYFTWDDNTTGTTFTTGPIVRDRDFFVAYVNQGGKSAVKRIRIHVNYAHLHTTVNNVEQRDTTVAVVNIGDKVQAGLSVNRSYKTLSYEWSNGATTPTQTFDNIQESHFATLTYSSPEIPLTIANFRIFVRDPDGDYAVTPGRYIIRHVQTGLLLTNTGDKKVKFTQQQSEPAPASQTWNICTGDIPTELGIQSLADNLYIGARTGLVTSAATDQFRLEHAIGTQRFALRNRRNFYLTVSDEMGFDYNTQTLLDDYPYEFIPVEETGIEDCQLTMNNEQLTIFDLTGRRIQPSTLNLQPGIYIMDAKKVFIK